MHRKKRQEALGLTDRKRHSSASHVSKLINTVPTVRRSYDLALYRRDPTINGWPNWSARPDDSQTDSPNWFVEAN